MTNAMSAPVLPMDLREILRILPHRYPMLLVDRIVAYDPGRTIEGLKNVTFNEPFFQGHFPGAPVMPGVLLLEGMAQVGGILAYLDTPESIGSKLIYFAGIDGARFRQPVVPGDQVRYHLEMLKQKGRIRKMAGKALVDGQVVAEAELMATFA